MNEAEEYLLKHCQNTLHKSFSPSGDIAIITITSKIFIPIYPWDIGGNNGVVLKWLHSFLSKIGWIGDLKLLFLL